MIKLTQEDYNILFTSLERYASDIHEDPFIEEKDREDIIKQIESVQNKLEIY